MIWRPNFAKIGEKESDHFLELNLTQEITKFDAIGSTIPNRALAQQDIFLYGLHYLQQISDRTTNGALHLEPGVWITIPESTQPTAPLPNQVARLASVPHGATVVMQGQATYARGKPKIQPANVNPFAVADGLPPVFFPELKLHEPSPYRNQLPPPELIDPAMLQQITNDPNLLLRTELEKARVLNTTTIKIATAPSLQDGKGGQLVTPNADGGAANIGFLKNSAGTPPSPGGDHGLPNAYVADAFATLWIEEIDNPYSRDNHFQLQYSQTVYLRFGALLWPHISVATLVKSSVV